MSSAPTQQENDERACFARWCSSHTKVANILAHIDAAESCDAELMAQMASVLFGFDDSLESRQEASVYRTRGAGHDSLGYRAGMVAVALGAPYFDPDGPGPSKAKHRRRRGATLLILECALHEHACCIPHTPRGCLTFTPSMRFHHDMECGAGTGQSVSDFLQAIFEIIRAQCVSVFYVDANIKGVEPIPFSLVAETVARYAYYEYGLDPDERWEDLSPRGKSAVWQVKALERLIDIFGIKPESVSREEFVERYGQELQSF